MIERRTTVRAGEVSERDINAFVDMKSIDDLRRRVSVQVLQRVYTPEISLHTRPAEPIMALTPDILNCAPIMRIYNTHDHIPLSTGLLDEERGEGRGREMGARTEIGHTRVGGQTTEEVAERDSYLAAVVEMFSDMTVVLLVAGPLGPCFGTFLPRLMQSVASILSVGYAIRCINPRHPACVTLGLTLIALVMVIVVAGFLSSSVESRPSEGVASLAEICLESLSIVVGTWIVSTFLLLVLCLVLRRRNRH